MLMQNVMDCIMASVVCLCVVHGEVQDENVDCKYQQEVIGQNMIKQSVRNSLGNSSCPPGRV